ncbi:hypothetical protein [Treponema pedis]|uniref:hypothetical protein n=1 Tax=Treponema pedis TaxID=409322 RepID=UPI000465D2C5|nr:hypothetical protein [Treponema pedis]QSI04606.1 hypothetical protein DYQ05_06485 [Treponema pedis]
MRRSFKLIIDVLFLFVLVILLLVITNPLLIPKVVQQIKLANEVSFEYVILLDRLDELQIKYLKNPSLELEKKIKETEYLLQKKYPNQIGPPDK